MSDSRKTILLVEDETIIAFAETQKLTGVGYSVVHAPCGERAIELFRADPGSYDLILMDIDLGAGIDGTEAAREILRTHDVPILFLSSHMEPETVEKTEAIANYGYVVKSSVFTVLDASIKMSFKLFESQKRLAESEARLTRAESVAGIGNWKYRLGSDLVTASEGAMRLYGLPKRECRLSEIQSITLPEHRPRLDEALAALVRKGEAYDCYFKIRQLGTGSILDIHSIAEYDADRGMIFGVLQNVTSMSKAEEKAQREHLFLKTLIDNLPDPVYFNDTEGRKIIANRADIENIGIGDREEILGKTDLQLFPGEVGARGHGDNLAVIESGEPIINREESFERADGGARWLLTSKIPLRDQGGTVIGLVGIGRDITERKIAEDSAAQERVFLRTLIDNLPDPVYFKDLSGRKTISNIASFHSKEPNAENDQLGKTDFELFPPEIALRGQRDDQQVFAGKPILNREEDFLDEDGTVYWLLTSKVPLRNARGEIIGLLGIGRDITEQKRLEESLRLAADQKSTLMKELEHRVKNNLSVVSSLLNLELDTIGDESARRVLGSAIGRIDSISSVYESLCSSDDLATVDMREYVDGLVDSIRRAMAPDEDRLRVTKALAEFRLDASRAVPVGLILNEMLTNAIKYAYPPATEGEIRVSLEEGAGLVRLTVSDDGAGLPKGTEPGRAGGAGMSIMSMLAKQLRGELRVESAGGTSASLAFER